MRHLAYLASSTVLTALLLSGCAHYSPGIAVSGGAPGSGGFGSGTSGGTTSGGTGTSGGTTSGGTGGTSGGSGGTGGSGGSGNMMPVRPGPITQDFGWSNSESSDLAAFRAGPYQGVVNGGQSRAVAGSRVYVLQVNSSAYGNASVSLITSDKPADSIGHYVLSGEYGGFSIAGHYTCTAGHQVYVYARGGNSGDDGANSAIGLMALLGACPESGNFDTATPFIFVNEVTTVAAAYAMAGAAADATHVVSRDASALEIANAADFANIATGVAYSSLPSRPGIHVPQTKIHTLANILSACINSSAPTSISCTTLFSNARSNGTSGTTPDDTATAAINIARHPHTNIDALFGLQPKFAAPFLPALVYAPEDYELSTAGENSTDPVASPAAQGCVTTNSHGGG